MHMFSTVCMATIKILILSVYLIIVIRNSSPDLLFRLQNMISHLLFSKLFLRLLFKHTRKNDGAKELNFDAVLKHN